SVAHWQTGRSPRVIRATFLLMPVGSTSQRSVQVLGFGNFGYLTPLHRLIRFLFVRPAFCLGLPSDSQSPATPLPLANTSPCRVCRGLSPPSHQRDHHSQAGCACAQRAMPGAPKKSHSSEWLFFESWSGKRDSYLASDSLKSKGFVFLSEQEKTRLWTCYWDVSTVKRPIAKGAVSPTACLGFRIPAKYICRT
ncbi:hypothetical protein SAMN03159306_05366, partial [Pseudomonas sp. NFACC48-1]